MDYLQINRDSWDKRTKIHVESEFYNVAGFLSGTNTLKEIELAELTQVQGKKLLHLQCQFGLDTLSWARLGAIVTGVDLSPVAIEKADQIKRQAKLDAVFICSDVYSFGETVQPDYDIVFTSYGSICWLPSLEKWAKTIASSLKPDGIFYMAEFHPYNEIIAGYDYFNSSKPIIEEEGTYTENCDGEKTTLVTWTHPLSEIINALISAGFRINFMHEFPFSPFNCFDNLIEREDGKFYYSNAEHEVPVVFSIKATKMP